MGLDPEAGDVITGTGGARKLRWAVGAEGKRGGVRVIYYFGGEDMPVMLFAIYKKGRKDNLTQDEKAELKTIIKQIQKEYRKEK